MTSRCGDHRAGSGGIPSGCPIFVDRTLAAEPQIVFNGGTHHDAIAMRYADFALIVAT
jgi:prolyl-tRNA editing enzyme YbaK/EbsC (Cys-tRNA(Pro) deacylase)